MNETRPAGRHPRDECFDLSSRRGQGPEILPTIPGQLPIADVLTDRKWRRLLPGSQAQNHVPFRGCTRIDWRRLLVVVPRHRLVLLDRPMAAMATTHGSLNWAAPQTGNR